MNKQTTDTSRIRLMALGALLLAAAVLAACNTAEPEAPASVDATAAATEAATVPPTNQTLRGQATVDSIDIMMLESFPVQVNVVARGNLPDSCTQIDDAIAQRTDDVFRVVITTIRPPDAVCTQGLVPFEESISLDVAGLPAGAYTVNVNDVSGTFTLDVDNAIPEATVEAMTTPEVTPEATPSTGAMGGLATGAISGSVWHDLCAATGSEAAEGAPADGCVTAAGGTTQIGNGALDEGEEGIAGVQLHLLPGDCTAALPGDEQLVLTGEDGSYRFEGLAAGTYCVFLDTADDHNATALEEGLLTYPTSDGVVTNSVTVTVEDGAELTDVNFGFDYRFRPVPEAAADCTNSIEFVQDLTVPDDTVFAPGTEFEASWRLKNSGTCPWTEAYRLTLVGGDAMGALEPQPLPGPVAPGQTVDASVTLTAPAEPGTYRGNWQLADAAGTPFGINGVAEDAFWVQIVVEEGATPAATPAPNSGTIGGVVWEDVCFLDASGNPSRGCVETEEGSGFYRGDGTLNFGESVLSGVTVVLGNGACPDGGVIAPADQVATAVTGDDGLYRFTGLDAGLYCVAIDALSPANVDLLIPGNWTYPAPGTGRLGVRLAAGEERLTVDFGWDYQE